MHYPHRFVPVRRAGAKQSVDVVQSGHWQVASTSSVYGRAKSQPCWQELKAVLGLAVVGKREERDSLSPALSTSTVTRAAAMSTSPRPTTVTTTILQPSTHQHNAKRAHSVEPLDPISFCLVSLKEGIGFGERTKRQEEEMNSICEYQCCCRTQEMLLLVEFISVLPTAQTLSDDVLHLIFLHALPSEFILRDIENPKTIWTISPLNVSLVSRSWRAVVSSHPSLWSSICIRDGRYEYLPLSDSICHFLAKWFTFSCSAPLKIFLDLFRSESDQFPSHLIRFVHAERHRWKDIHVEIYSREPSDPPRARFSISIVPRHLPLLTSLTLKFTFGGESDFANPLSPPAFIDLSSCITIGPGSQLRKLCVGPGVGWLLPFPRDALCLQNLQDLKISTDIGADLEDTFHLLSGCPNMSTLNITTLSIAPSPSTLSSLNPIILPSITHFTLTSTNRITTQRVLGRLSCPSLRTFAVLANMFIYHERRRIEPVEEKEHTITPRLLRSFDDFLSRSGSRPSLEELKIQYYPFVEYIDAEMHHEIAVALRGVLGGLDQLKRLSFTGMAIDNEVIELMTVRAEKMRPGESNSLLCPSLAEMEILPLKSDSLQKEKIEELIASRWRTNMLKEVTLIISGFKNLGAESEQVKKCVEEGLTWHHKLRQRVQ